MQETNYKWIRQWREAQPERSNNCAHCGKEYRTRQFQSMYCCALCRCHAHREKKRAARATLYCDLCGVELGKRKTRFCTNEHKTRFWTLVKANKPVPVKVSASTTLMTKKYDRIAEVRAEWRARNPFAVPL